jgi:hypothetical protein
LNKFAVTNINNDFFVSFEKLYIYHL